MIWEKDGVWALETDHTGYYIGLRGTLAENLHYGQKLTWTDDAFLREKLPVGYGSDVVYSADLAPLSLEHVCLELSPPQKGDYRAPALALTMPTGAATADFRFVCARVHAGSCPPPDMPGGEGAEQTLELRFATPEGVTAVLWYGVYPSCDVITRRIVLENHSDAPVQLHKIMSYQLDLPGCDYTLSTFTGAWARECHETRTPLAVGERCFGSRTGASGQFCNPFFMLAQRRATEQYGDVYGFNLIYSGSHAGCVEVSPFGKTRVMAGIQPEGFCAVLTPGQSFAAPEAVLTFSPQGKNGMSANMHRFVRNHIVRGAWAKRDRPVLLNSWEAMYFNFTEAKLVQLARTAAQMGIELFVLDDGWFGSRNSDKSGLGDYAVNRKKLPNGLDGLAHKINALGLQFGLWMEPEMVNADSDLYRAHPDWAVATPGNTPCTGRNQYVLDLCRTDVQDHIIAQVDATLNSAPIAYVKWDMNRHISDAYSPVLAQQGEFAHRYILGLYRVLSTLVRRHPDVLFEGCSSGGNRFDLGILCYMPQIWASDDTDAYERQHIQTGLSYGYPPSVMGCHVSASPNHQTARSSPLESRFNVAAFGLLGYELDLGCLSPAERKAVAAQITWYKAHRHLLQYGRFVRLQTPQDDGACAWMAVSDDKQHAVVGEFMHLLQPNSAKPPLRLDALDAKQRYRVQNRAQVVDVRTFGGLINHILPVKVNAAGLLMHIAADHYMMPCETEQYTAYGDALMGAGIKQKQAFTGTGYNQDVRLMPDFSSRLYTLDADLPHTATQEEPS